VFDQHASNLRPCIPAKTAPFEGSAPQLLAVWSPLIPGGCESVVVAEGSAKNFRCFCQRRPEASEIRVEGRSHATYHAVSFLPLVGELPVSSASVAELEFVVQEAANGSTDTGDAMQ
jgi:hypothetical protein